jgi:hypothetical protein
MPNYIEWLRNRYWIEVTRHLSYRHTYIFPSWQITITVLFRISDLSFVCVYQWQAKYKLTFLYGCTFLNCPLREDPLLMMREIVGQPFCQIYYTIFTCRYMFLFLSFFPFCDKICLNQLHSQYTWYRFQLDISVQSNI